MPARSVPDLFRRPRAAVAALVFAATALWSLAIPLMASPDEPSHTIKAAAVVRGQLDGRLGEIPVDETQPGTPTYVLVPNDIAAVATLPDCFRFDDEVTAVCQTSLPPRDGRLVESATYAGQYPPLYYLLVGWPSLLLSGAPAIYGMRLAAAALAAGFLVWGLRPLADRGRRCGLWGAVIALTPMCLFMGGMVNPNGLEIAAGFAFWTACLALATADKVRTATMVQAVVAGAVLVTVRTSGPVWAVLIVLLVVVTAKPDRLRALLQAPQSRWAAATAVAAAVGAVAWIATHGAIVSTADLHPEFAAPRLVAIVMLLSTEVFLEQMIGNFGWLDTQAPYPTVLAWLAAGSTLVLLAIAGSTRRRATAGIILAVAAVVVAPIVLTIPTAQAAGIVWQGRYALPLAVGVPLLAAMVLADVGGPTARLLDRLHGLALPLLALAHIGAFYWAVRRYATGMDGSWITVSPEWNPPLGFLPSVVAYTAVLAALCWIGLVTLHRPAEPVANI